MALFKGEIFSNIKNFIEIGLDNWNAICIQSLTFLSFGRCTTSCHYVNGTVVLVCLKCFLLAQRAFDNTTL